MRKPHDSEHPPEIGVRALLVDPHPVTLSGLRSTLEAQADVAIVGETDSGWRALALAEVLRPNAVVLELRLHDVSGVELIRRFRGSCPGARIVVFTGEDEPHAVRAALAAGASAYLLKTATAEEVVAALRATRRGQVSLQREVAERLASLYDQSVPAEALSPRELEVLAHVARGKSNHEIATALHLAVKTVEMHVGNLLAKLGARSRTQAATLALRSGLIWEPSGTERDPGLGSETGASASPWTADAPRDRAEIVVRPGHHQTAPDKARRERAGSRGQEPPRLRLLAGGRSSTTTAV